MIKDATEKKMLGQFLQNFVGHSKRILYKELNNINSM